MKNKKRLTLTKTNILGIFLSFIAIVSIITTALGYAQVFAADCVGSGCDGYSGGAGPGKGGANTATCKSGNCYSLWKNGAFWIKVAAPSDDIDPMSLGIFTGVFTRSHITGCATGGGAAYILVTPSSGGGLYGMVSIDDASRKGGVHDGTAGPGYEGVTVADAQSTFAKDADFYKEQHGMEYSGTDLTWFCADIRSQPPKTKTLTTPPPLDCKNKTIMTREWGETRTRIAVRNASLDGSSWNATGLRSGLPSDSGWNDGGGTYFTIGKPGDSVQFIHEVCMGARYVRRTEHQSVQWTRAESHNKEFYIPEDHFQIYGTPVDNYAFGYGIPWINAVAETVSQRGPDLGEPYPFNDNPDRHGGGVWISSERYGAGVLSPTPDNNEGDCMGVAQFASRDPYISNATYQIPGFDSIPGTCNAVNVSGVSNPVGSTVGQYHDFNRIKAWEQHTTDYHGSCGCNVHDAEWDGHTFSPEFGKPRAHFEYRRDYVCNNSPDCTLCCDCVHWDEYGRCDKYIHDRWSLTKESYDYEYQSKSKDYGVARKTAEIRIPFNYTTTVTSHLDAGNGDVIFEGTGVGSSFDWSVEPRANPPLTEGSQVLKQYATVTPSWTRVRMVEFLYAPESGRGDIGADPWFDDRGTDPGDPMAGPCHKFSGAIECKEIMSYVGNQNPQGLYDGADGSANAYRTVPDSEEYVGYKYCVAVGFYPADSHDNMGNALWQQYSGGWGGAMDAGELWNISGASCRAIAKKPSFQVWNGSVYTQGQVISAITKKMLGVTLGNNYYDAQTSIFGSWVDYAIISNSTVKGTASGAMLGFNNSKYDLRGTGGQPVSVGSDLKNLSPQTISNTGSTIGKSNIKADSSIELNLKRLRSRYSEKAEELAKSISTNGIRTTETGLQYAYSTAGTLSLSTIASNIENKGMPNETTHNGGDGVYKTLSPEDDTNDNTLVIYVPNGTFYIDKNICLGNGCNGDGMKLFDYDNTSTNAASRIPQILIFAKNIVIDQEVSRVDAWLIAGDKEGHNGVINTCTDHMLGGEDNNKNVGSTAYKYGSNSTYSGSEDHCGDKTLIINGPVYATTLSLLRSAGAYHSAGNNTPLTDPRDRQYGAVGEGKDKNLGSKTPAEIFNLRADAYLWAYNQAQRYSEAVVTYMRELAPRY